MVALRAGSSARGAKFTIPSGPSARAARLPSAAPAGAPITCAAMFRVTFLIGDPAERRDFATGLRSTSIGGDARIVSAFEDAKTVDLYVEVGDPAAAPGLFDEFAQRLGVREFEVAEVEPLLTGSVERATGERLSRRPDSITQVRLQPDDRTLSVQVRHRPNETVETVEVEQSDEAVAISVWVAAAQDPESGQYASLAIAFTWIDTVLDRPLGDRKVIRHVPGPGASAARAH
jgi:hypothetical protein